MNRLNLFVKKWLNKAPTIKRMLVRIIFVNGEYTRLTWIYYNIYFFLINVQFSLSRSRGSIKKNPIIKSAIFLLPKYMGGKDLCVTSEGIVLCFKELHPDIPVECVYFDTDEFIRNKESCLRHIVAVKASHFIYLYGPNQDFSLTWPQLKALLLQIDSYKIIIATDSITLPHSYFLNKLKNDVDMIATLDAPLRFSSRRSRLIGPLVTPLISQRAFERFIRPNLSIPKDIDILIAGSQYRKRLAIADFLRQNGLKITLLGGKSGNDRMSYDQYLSISCRAKIRIITQFTHNELHIHLKGHVPEAAATQALMFLDSPYPASVYFDEGKEFISFASKKELLEKIIWYLSHDEERVKIAAAAHKRWIENYSGNKFWENILGR